MKRLILVLTLLLVSYGTGQAGEQDFTLINNSGRPICDVYISPDDARDWQEDLLEGDKYCLANGEQITITFDRSFKGVKLWDLRVVDNKGRETIYEDFNLSRISTITLRRDGTAEYR
ncbi:MAG: hypothetical protein IJU65_00500 [Desulfovibrio sp.]|nr:hypothetical protein [Desulfovibrio sp.]